MPGTAASIGDMIPASLRPICHMQAFRPHTALGEGARAQEIDIAFCAPVSEAEITPGSAQSDAVQKVAFQFLFIGFGLFASGTISSAAACLAAEHSGKQMRTAYVRPPPPYSTTPFSSTAPLTIANLCCSAQDCLSPTPFKPHPLDPNLEPGARAAAAGGSVVRDTAHRAAHCRARAGPKS